MKLINQAKNQMSYLYEKIGAYKQKLIISFLVAAGTLTSSPVFAQDTTGGTGGENGITQSILFKGFMKFLQDGMVALLIITPIAGGVLLAIFSLMIAAHSEQHDKEKWTKNRKNALITIAFIFSISAVVGIISFYFNAGQTGQA